MNLDDFPEWSDTLESICASGGSVLLIGGIDTGKTTLAGLLANYAASGGKTVSIVDADLGQSEIGPPGCVGLGILSEPIHSLGDLKPAGLAFVGSTAPRGCMLEHVVAIRRMADQAIERIPDILVVDTTGFIQGQPAARLKQAKADVIRPRHVVALQRARECEPILRILSCARECLIHRLPVPAVIRRKPPGYRAQRRAARFAVYFQDSELQKLSFDKCAFSHTWLNSGVPAPPNILKFLTNSARAPVRYAEQSARFLGIVVDRECPLDLGLIQEQLKAESISITPAFRYNHLLVGLSDGERLLGLGLIANVDFTRRILEVMTPIKSAANIRLVHFGIIRVRPDGKELGVLRPGEI